ncbi:uncharacterized protein HD556DRAFT_1305033 [Suillus plorans]|uniref:Retrotransposon gag domain-containing protein n=1 Tax=Suillus plorans TaxID=116603 RepID=A0A9P7DQ24_9AGAM|nr:uncharacterized protein HD556DRAFT_1305033 [Suillus plorans]KAG1800246.1 hypothetical protein HD556DRAFT_1305033 [Suillus plorans]
MTTVHYDLRPLNQRAWKILPTLKPPGALPNSPFDSPLMALDDTPETAPFEVTRSETSVLRTIRSCSDVIRVRSPWFGLRGPKEKTMEQVSVAENTPDNHTESVEDVNRILSMTLPPAPSAAGPDSESDESDDDGCPWITVRQKQSPEGAFSGKVKPDPAEPHVLMMEQESLVREAERRLTHDEHEKLHRRQSKIHSQAESHTSLAAGPSKGKATDPRKWGASGLDKGDLDLDTQHTAFEAWNAAKAAREVTSNGEEEGSLEHVPEVKSIKVSKEELKRLIHKRAVEAVRVAEVRLECKYEKKIRKLKKDSAPTKESTGTAVRLQPVQSMIEKVVKPLTKTRAASEMPRAMQPVHQVTAQSYIGRALSRVQSREPKGKTHNDSDPSSDDPSSSSSSESTLSESSNEASKSSTTDSRKKSSKKKKKKKHTILKPVPPTVYDGEVDSRAFHRFITEGTAYVKDGCVKHKARVFTLSRYLTGKVHEFYIREVAGDPYCWQLPEFFNELFNHCFPVNLQTELCAKLKKCYQNDKTVRAYFYELSKLWNMIGDIDKRHRVERLWFGLRTNI